MNNDEIKKSEELKDEQLQKSQELSDEELDQIAGCTGLCSSWIEKGTSVYRL